MQTIAHIRRRCPRHMDSARPGGANVSVVICELLAAFAQLPTARTRGTQCADVLALLDARASPPQSQQTTLPCYAQQNHGFFIDNDSRSWHETQSRREPRSLAKKQWCLSCVHDVLAVPSTLDEIQSTSALRVCSRRTEVGHLQVAPVLFLPPLLLAAVAHFPPPHTPRPSARSVRLEAPRWTPRPRRRWTPP